MESCYAKTAMSGAAGFALGGLFGMFMASVRSSPWPLLCLQKDSVFFLTRTDRN